MTTVIRRPRVLAAAVLAAAAGLAAPAVLAPAAAANGGAQLPAAGAPASALAAPASDPAPAGGATGGAEPGSTTATASANGITITARAAALLRRRTTVSGAAPARVGRVRIETRGPDGRWSAVATAAVTDRGTFSAAWRPRALGAQQLRAVAAGGATPASEAPPQVTVTVYRPGVASWYGPGFYGGRTACGLRLRRTTVGVAHRTLPCGSQVQLHYRGRTLVVPVIDRGPFVAGRSWDLTKRTHALLGGGRAGLITVGALQLPDAPRLATPYDAPAARG